MTERKMAPHTIGLKHWVGVDTPLSELRQMVDRLIEKYGADAVWFLDSDDDGPYVTLTFKRLETDEEAAARSRQESNDNMRRAAAESARAKLTDAEWKAVAARMPPGSPLRQAAK